jgi:hypothetical protein
MENQYSAPSATKTINVHDIPVVEKKVAPAAAEAPVAG